MRAQVLTKTTPKPAGKLLSRLYPHRDVLALFVLFFLFNAIISLFFSAPVSYPDEYGVLSVANYLGGQTEWLFPAESYYGYAHSVFISLLFRLFSDIRTIYVGALLINAVIVAFIPVFCYKFLNEVLALPSRIGRLAISLVCGLYPYFTIYSKLTRNEPLLCLFIFLCLYTIGKCLLNTDKRRRIFYSLCLAFLVNYAYAAHGLGLVFIIAVILTILFARILFKKDLVHYIAFISAFVVFYYLFNVLIKNHLMDVVYRASDGNLLNTFDYSFRRMLENAFSRKGLDAFIKGVIGRLHYLSSATFGTIIPSVIALLVVFFSLLRRRFSKAAAPLSSLQQILVTAIFFSGILLLGGMAVSTLNTISASRQYGGTYFFYCRYYEHMAVPLLILALYLLFTSKIVKKRLALLLSGSAVLYIGLCVFVQVYLIHVVETGLRKRYSIMGTLPFIGNSFSSLKENAGNSFRHYDLLPLAIVVLVVFAVISLFLLLGRRGAVPIVLSACFCYVIFFDLGSTLIPWSTKMDVSFNRYTGIQTQLDTTLHHLYQQYPEVYMIYNGEKATSYKARQVTQLALNNYSINSSMYMGTIRELENPEEVFNNRILIALEDCDLDALNPAYVQVHASDGCYIWLCGADIVAAWAAAP